MAYIYKITNKINGKIYIGKTYQSIEKRFRQHCQDSQKESISHRPLYSAMRKYGCSNFEVELIEETDRAEEREVFWIEYYGSFKNGYNATTGGDGRPYVDVDLIIATYAETQNRTKVAELLGISIDTVTKYLVERGIKVLTSQEIMAQRGKLVNMYDLSNNFVQTFSSINAAATYMVDNGLTGCKHSTIKQHISEVCRGKRKTAAKFKWAFA
jgi:predicted transcriptional regulator